ncbi:hypothetical protein [Natrialba asiatica]|uniref:Uncharacterized protein n=1 Tax=Natrialba asiatica (strain ATCC 700177 / DSM 12278 / JCM 9576 / FERM P-10747 / NBRC 102637 / 172P1) TaxID=29540 RepID=M0AIH5_NATA1|nr:hypothetical protein [Natrialba asiatica]ELY98156.1 hypothetical protein C481_19520 [Natrialba asiatica DSM 12278]
MSNILENPVYRYGMGLSSAAILAFVAISYLEGMTRLLVLGFAAFELVLFRLC